MTIRKFEAPTIMEAYSRLKMGMGPNAIIHRTQTIKKGGILGLWGRRVIEITASDEADVKTPVKIRRRPGNKLLEKTYGASATSAQNQSVITLAEAPAVETEEGSLESLKNELMDIRKMVQGIQEAGRYRHWPDLPQEFEKAYRKLLRQNIEDDIAKAMIHRWKSHYPDYQSGTKVDTRLLEAYVEEMVVPAGPIRLKENGSPQVVMLVGPTGVGKTTTLAKLAARFKLKDGIKVGFITLDTYRIAAVEQLRTYADLIGVPLKVVSTHEDLGRALEHFRSMQLILIDTAGRSPRNAEKMRDLQNYVKIAKPDELHLVLSMNIHNDVMQDALKRYEPFPVTKLLLTKLDETTHYGSILSIISKTQKPIGYLTTGQEVPEDIEVASGRRLSRLILGLDQIHA
ncbi:MAG: flagellar biosynthesis protein FlhF [Planctomycetes bacterium]|nr:flagellar biosynthesis protein FlhF [Planctomycetota bacterium]